MERENPTTNRLRLQESSDPRSQLRPLSGTQLRLLDEIANLCRYHARHSPRGGRWCQPGREYLARKVGRSIWQISRATNDPRFTRLIEHHQQRKQRGAWRTCKYYVRHPKVWAWAHALDLTLARRTRPNAPELYTKTQSTYAKTAPKQPRAPNRTHTYGETTELSPRTAVPPALQAVLDSIAAKLKRDGTT